MRKKESWKILANILDSVKQPSAQTYSLCSENQLEEYDPEDLFDSILGNLKETFEMKKCDEKDFIDYFEDINNEISAATSEIRQAKTDSKYCLYCKLTFKKLRLKWTRSNMKARRALDIGDLYKEANTLYLEKKYSESFPLMLKVASLHHREAQFLLAVMYKNGLGTERNYGEAFKWYYRVAKYELKIKPYPDKDHRTALREAACLFRQGKVPMELVRDGRRIDNVYRCIIEAEKYQNLSYGHAGQY